MRIVFHPHAYERMKERGATEAEVIETVRNGESFPAKYGRHGYRKNFRIKAAVGHRRYSAKQIEAYCVHEARSIVVVTVIVKYF
jgi:hypothetical protein